MTCPSSTARTGAQGKVVVEGQLIARITGFQINESIGETAWGDSDSVGFTNRKGGRRDATISFEGKFDTDTKIWNLMRPGDEVKLVLWESTDDSDYWVFPCVLIQSYNTNVNVDTREVIGWQATAGADGQYYYPGEAGAPTETLPS